MPSSSRIPPSGRATRSDADPDVSTGPERDRHELGDAPLEDQRRRYQELLEELRTILPGVQVLLAFLLSVPFAPRFAELDALGTALFVAALACSALSVVVFLVPAASHRMSPESRRRVHTGAATTVAGLGLLAASIVTGIVVVVRFVAGDAWAAIVAGAVLATIAALWLALPLASRRADR